MNLIDVLTMWIEIIKMIISLVEVVFIIAAFWVAERFLKNHSAKIRIENQEKYAVQIIELLDQFEEVLRKILINEIQNQKELEDLQRNKLGIPADYLLPFLKLHWIKHRFKSSDQDIFKITQKVTNLGIYLNDPDISPLYRQVFGQYLEIIKQFTAALKKQSDLFQFWSEENSREFPKNNLEEIYSSLPKSIYDSDNPLLKDYIQKHEKLIAHISNKYIN